MREPSTDSGFVAPVALFILLGMGLLLWSVSRYGMAVNRKVDAALERKRVESSLYAGIEWIADLLSKDSTPGGNSWRDLIDPAEYSGRIDNRFRYQLESGVQLLLEECSSRLNPNFDRLDFWRESFLGKRVTDRASLARWERARLNEGFARNPGEVEWIPHRKDWERYYTLYSPLCVMGTEREVVDAYLMGQGWSRVDVARFWRELGGVAVTSERLREVVALYGAAPGIQVEAGWNVNFMDESLLSALIDFPWAGSGFRSPDRLRMWVVRARMEGEVSHIRLEMELVDEHKGAREAFLARFGTHSWFWRVEAALPGCKLVAYLRRCPPEPQDGGGELSTIQLLSVEVLRGGER